MALAALGGIAAAPVIGLYPGMDSEILIPAFIVIVIGGMGSLRGAFVGSLLIGIADTFGKAYFQSIALFLIYLAMTVVLADPAARLVRHQIYRYRDRACHRHDEPAEHGAAKRHRISGAVGALGAAVPDDRLSARARFGDLYLRDLRHEPRSIARLAWKHGMPDLASALYFSAVTYTTTGYGDLVLPKQWRLVGGVEALTGILMCGLSTGLFFAVFVKVFDLNRGSTPTA